MASSRASAAALFALAVAGCGDASNDASASADGGATADAVTDVGADSAPEVPLVEQALEGRCPGGKPPESGVPPGTDLHKVTLDAYPNARCNDGSPAIMYVRAAANAAASSRWVIHMQAGGSCGSHRVCLERWCGIGAYDASKMSSRFAPMVTRGNGLFARTAGNAFADFNHVYVYYCSSDFHLGRRGDVVLTDETGTHPPFRLHFRGHDILEAVADALAKGVTSDDGVEKLPSLGGATQVLFSGSSAGSNGLSQSLDWWASKVPGAKVAGMLDSVLLPLPEDVTDPVMREKWEAGIRHEATKVRGELYDAFTDESCLAKHPGDDRYLCALTSHVQLDHLTTPFFTRQDLTDPVTYGYVVPLGASLDQYAAWTLATLKRLKDVKSKAEEKDAIVVAPGVHASNCGQHIVMLNGPWFGTAPGEKATVKNAAGADTTVHDALVAWATGTPIAALDTHPKTASKCLATTSDR